MHQAVWDYSNDIKRLAAQLCRHREDAEDVAQSALMKAAEHLGDFRAEASLRTWLHRIATNECRMLRRRPPPESLERRFETVIESDRALSEPSASEPLPEELVLEAERRLMTLHALEGLPDRHRAALLLKDGRGLSAEEIASLMETTVPTVRALLHRGRRMLRERLRTYVEGGS